MQIFVYCFPNSLAICLLIKFPKYLNSYICSVGYSTVLHLAYSFSHPAKRHCLYVVEGTACFNEADSYTGSSIAIGMCNLVRQVKGPDEMCTRQVRSL